MIEEYDLFSYSMPKFRINKPIRLIELFAGIGAQAKALENLGVEFEHWKAVEIDKYAIASYNAIHGTNFETLDITKIHAADLKIAERERYCYIMTYSFPCQDLSIAGKMQGMKKGENTRSGLLWEVERILDECSELPQVLLMENVPQVIGKKNIKDFQLWRGKLESLGYSNYVQLLNAKDYGIPQNRNRCFMVSVLGNYHYTFPKKKKLELKLKDMLEDKVDEKYYLSDEMVKFFVSNSEKQKEKGNGFRFEPAERRVSKTVAVKMDRTESEWVLDSSTEEQGNTSQTRFSPQTDVQELSRADLKPETLSRSSKRSSFDKDVSNSVRRGGRGSLDRHQWDIVLDENNDR